MRAALVIAAIPVVTVCVAAGDTGAPQRLSDTGLHAPEVRAFSPQYPLWSDGATKRRWVYLPPGAAIDDSDPNAWDLPVGTRFWKQFDFHGRKVETRMIWRASRERWVFASYRWNADGTEATLAPSEGVPGAADIAPGKHHTIPAVNDCTACHGAQRPGPLGFTALQLSEDRDPNAIHAEPLGPGMVTLRTLVAEGRLKRSGASLVANPPRIASGSARTRAALGYLVANCGGCHNGRGDIAALGPTLRIDALLADGDAVARAMVAQPTRWQVPGMAEGQSLLLNPAAVEKSALLVRMRSRSPLSQMPPLGTVVRDTAAVDALTAWASAVGQSARR